ncbi:MAG TPA: hypothetical protein VM144_15330 [Aestuariivirga sp.]|nr:hypothetical protein [Aestuariivirga sp.]
MQLLHRMSFRSRFIFSFLAVPWLPIVFLAPYSVFVGKSDPLEWDTVRTLLQLSVIVAIATYLLEATVIIPIWRSMLRSGKTTLLRFAAIGFVIAFVFSFAIISLLTGLVIFMKWEFAVLVPLFAVIGAAEAVLFWLIVRPDIDGPGSSTNPKATRLDAGD